MTPQAGEGKEPPYLRPPDRPPDRPPPVERPPPYELLPEERLVVVLLPRERE